MKLFILVFSITLNLAAFSQTKSVRGTYHSVLKPSDAPSSPPNEAGVLEFPVKITEALIQLNGFQRLKIIVTYIGTDSVLVYKGKWTQSGKIINMKYETGDSLQISTFELVKLKSGSYIKLVNDNYNYFKKE